MNTDKYPAVIHFGEYIEKDMIAVRVSPDLTPVIVGSPEYFKSHAKVNGPLIVDDVELVIHAAADGVGLAYLDEENAAPQLASGSLVRVLEDWCQPFPGSSFISPAGGN